MKNYLAFILISFSIVLISSTAFANLDKNLKPGDSGADVKKLQELLNKDPNTQVASSGPGSPGQETNFFGAKTAVALSKFQEKFKEVILDPLGLQTGTGILGKLTRALLNELYGSNTGGHVLDAITNFNPSNLAGVTIPPMPPPIPEASNPISVNTNNSNGNNQTPTLPTVDQSDKVKIEAILPQGGNVNTQVTITGSGFSTSTAGNVVYVGGTRKTGVLSSDGKTLRVLIENPLGKSPLNTSETFKDSDGNTISVSGGIINIYSPVHGGYSLAPSSMSLSGSGQTLELPIGIYVEDNIGKISNTKTFKLLLQ